MLHDTITFFLGSIQLKFDKNSKNCQILLVKRNVMKSVMLLTDRESTYLKKKCQLEKSNKSRSMYYQNMIP